MNFSRQTIYKIVRVMLAVTVLVAIFAVANSAFACPTCKDGIANSDPNGQAMARGYFYSILFMMAMPFVIVGTFGGAAYLSIRRAREQQLAAQAERLDESVSS